MRPTSELPHVLGDLDRETVTLIAKLWYRSPVITNTFLPIASQASIGSFAKSVNTSRPAVIGLIGSGANGGDEKPEGEWEAEHGQKRVGRRWDSLFNAQPKSPA